MPLHIVMGDVAKMEVGAVVCPTDEMMSGGGGADLALHRGAGEEMRRACDAAGRCSADAPVVTSGFGLPCGLVVHTVGPIWRGGRNGEAEALERCALRALEAAAERGCESVALPLISSGTFGFPKPLALATLTAAVRKFLETHEADVFLVVSERGDFAIDAALSRRVSGFIDKNFAIDAALSRRVRGFANRNLASSHGRESYIDACFLEMPRSIDSGDDGEVVPAPCAAMSLEDELDSVEMGFRDALLRKIDERGMTDAECYKRANIDRKLFSKIRCNRDHSPSKDTALSLAIALMLPIAETRDLLERAGYALSRSSKRDVIVEYFIRRGRYDIFEINEALFAFGQKPLCS